MDSHDDDSEMRFRGTFVFQSYVSASQVEAAVLSARVYTASLMEIDVQRPDDQRSQLVIKVLDEPPVVRDAGTVYRAHLLPYGQDEVREVSILIPSPPQEKRALITVSY